MSLITDLVQVEFEDGDQGASVRSLQEYFSECGFPITVDGIYGPQTRRVLRMWQFVRFGAGAVDEDSFVTTLMMAEEAEVDSEDELAVVSLMATMREELLDEQYDGVWASLAKMRADYRSVETHKFGCDVAWVSIWLLTQSIQEASQNRGPWVDVIVELGGGDHLKADPWCARFVTACRVLASWLRSDVAKDKSPKFPRTGSASQLWILSSSPLTRGDAACMMGSIGGAFVRSRTNKPEWHAQVIRDGEPMPGHTGVVVDLEGNGFVGIAGNSSGSGHSKSSGAVAVELLAPTSGHAMRAWDRLVGVATE